MADPVWRGLTQAELEREYDARGSVGGDIGPFLARYRAGTDRARATLPCRLGVPYGDGPDEHLDLYLAPPTAAPAPVFIFIHGGYWRLLGSEDSGFMAEALTLAGAHVAVVNYGLAPATPLPEIVRQCRAAVAFIHRTAASFGGDPARLHVSGSSAGGHLAAMVLAPGWAGEAGLPEPAIASASLFSGLYDLEPMRLTLPNTWLRLDIATARAMSPLRHPPSGIDLLLAAGPTETAEFRRQTRAYAEVCRSAGCRVRHLEPAGTNHFDVVLELARDEGEVFGLVRSMLGLNSPSAPVSQ